MNLPPQEIKCPYCGFVNKVMGIEMDETFFLARTQKFMFCDNEEGGCDRQFSFKIVADIEITVSKLDYEYSQVEYTLEEETPTKLPGKSCSDYIIPGEFKDGGGSKGNPPF